MTRSFQRVTRRAPRLFAGAGALALIAVMTSTSCQSPTQITVEIRPYDLCPEAGARLAVAVTAGRPGITETAAPNAKATGCPPSGMYSIVYVPDGEKNTDVEFRV